MQSPDPIIDEAAIQPLLRAFYARIRDDLILGPVFNAAIHDWDEHLERIGDFWSSILLHSGRYKGNPAAMHLLHVDRITPEMFDRWLGLWALTTGEMLPSESAVLLQEKAARIANVLRFTLRLPPSDSPHAFDPPI